LLELTSIPEGKRTTTFRSSGTTFQAPGRHFHTAESLALYEASLWHWFRPNVLGDIQSERQDFHLLILTPPPDQAINSSLVHMFATVRQQLAAPKSSFLGKTGLDGLWTLDFEAAIAALNSALAARHPTLLLGTAFSFVHLLDYLNEKNLKFNLPAGSRVMETGGYKNRSRLMPKNELHALISEKLGVPAEDIICEYGMSELSSQAYAVTRGKWQATRNCGTSFHTPLVTCHFQFPPWARAQIVSPENGREVADGQTGMIRVFDLANVFSVAAIQTGDLGVRRGDGFELIGRAPQAESRGCSFLTS
jgi:hypothetical protein